MQHPTYFQRVFNQTPFQEGGYCLRLSTEQPDLRFPRIPSHSDWVGNRRDIATNRFQARNRPLKSLNSGWEALRSWRSQAHLMWVSEVPGLESVDINPTVCLNLCSTAYTEQKQVVGLISPSISMNKDTPWFGWLPWSRVCEQRGP